MPDPASTEQQTPMAESPQPQKTPEPKKNSKIFLLSLLIILVIGAVGFFILQKTISPLQKADISITTDDFPPQLASKDKIDKILREEPQLLTWKNEDQQKFQKIERHYQDNKLAPTLIPRGATTVYSDTATTLSDIAWKTNLEQPENQIAIAHYNTTEQKYITYPEIPELDTSITRAATDPTEYTIPAQSAFTIISTEETEIYGLYKGEKKALQKSICDASRSKVGWNLATIDKKNLYSAVEPCLENIKLIYLERNGNFTLTYNRNQNSPETLKDTNLESYIAWVYFESAPKPYPDTYKTDKEELIEQKEEKQEEVQAIEEQIGQAEVQEDSQKVEQLTEQQDQIKQEISTIEQEIEEEEILESNAEEIIEVIHEIKEPPKKITRDKTPKEQPAVETETPEPTPEPEPTPGPEPQQPPTPPENPEAYFVLHSPTEDLPACEPSEIQIIINTDSQKSLAADAIIKFDQNAIDILEVKPTEIFDLFAPHQIKDGIFYLTATNFQAPYITKNENGDLFATLSIKSRPGITKTKLSFDFTEGKTTDANISDDQGESDLLAKVKNLELTFTDQGSCPSTEPQTTDTGPTYNADEFPTYPDIETSYEQQSYLTLDPELTELTNSTIRTFFQDVEKQDFTESYDSIAKLWQEDTSLQEFTNAFMDFFPMSEAHTYIQTTPPSFTREPIYTTLYDHDSLKLQGRYISKENVISFVLTYIDEDGWKPVSLDIKTLPVINYQKIGLYDLTKISEQDAATLIHYTMSILARDLSEGDFNNTYLSISDSLKAQLSAEDFSTAFSDVKEVLEQDGVDLLKVQTLTPIFTSAPRLIRQNQDIALLKAKGHYETSPKLLFELEYFYEHPHWKPTNLVISTQ